MQSSLNSPRRPRHTVRHFNGGRVPQGNLPHDSLPHDNETASTGNSPRFDTSDSKTDYFSNVRGIRASGLTFMSVGGNVYEPDGTVLYGPGTHFITDRRTSTTAVFGPRKDSGGDQQAHDLLGFLDDEASSSDNESPPPTAQSQTLPQQPSPSNWKSSHSADELQVASPYDSDLEAGKLYTHNAFDLIQRIAADPDYKVELNGFVCIWKQKQKAEVPVDSDC